MKKYDFTIIGAGIVGLSTAYQLLLKNPLLKILILEKENAVAKHQTGHNSGVIHSGIYYKPGSLKAQNCINGYKSLIEFCNTYGIPYELCGKIIVATNQNEIPELNKLYQRGLENGLDQIQLLNQEQTKELEPNVNAIQSIQVPYTGIISYTAVCNQLQQLITEKGCQVFFNQKVNNIEEKGHLAFIHTDTGIFETKHYINCAGLYSDKIAQLTSPQLDTRIIPFRGEYFLIKPEKQALVKNLIYPVPDPNFPFLGVHFTRMINGHIEAGPNAVFAFQREGYQMADVDAREMLESLAWPGFQLVVKKYWKTGMGEFYRSFSKAAFTKALQKLIPDITEDDLVPAGSGVRAQACDRMGGLLDDFKIVENNRGIHLLNAPSPAATSCLSIGNTLSDISLKRIEW
jgi:L-2-hydroxyglutarate oxidase